MKEKNLEKILKNVNEYSKNNLLKMKKLKDDQLVARLGGENVLYSFFKTLDPGGYLHSECINFYMLLLEQRNLKINKNCKFLSVGLFQYVNNFVNFSQVANKGLDSTLTNNEHLCLPVNIENTHWIMLEIINKDKKIIIKDSLGGTNQKIVDILLLYFFCRNVEIFNNWKLNFSNENFDTSLNQWNKKKDFEEYKLSWKIGRAHV